MSQIGTLAGLPTFTDRLFPGCDARAGIEQVPLQPAETVSLRGPRLKPALSRASWLNRIKCHFWALGEFVVKNADYESWEELAGAMARHISYRNGPHRDRRLAAVERRRRVA